MENETRIKYQFILKIAGLRCLVSLNNKQIVNSIYRRYKGYIFPAGGSSHFYLNLITSKKPFARGMKPRIKWAGDLASAGLSRKDFEAILTGKNVKASIHPSIFSFDALIRILWSFYLPEIKGVLLHSSAIVYKGRAYIFSGKSGAGKTTISRLSECHILNDEIVALVKGRGGKWAVWGTPFWGEMGSGPCYARGYPLGRLYFIKKSRGDFAEPQNQMLSLSSLLKVVCFFDSSSKSSQRLLDLILPFLDSHPPRMLFFTKSRKFLNLLNNR